MTLLSLPLSLSLEHMYCQGVKITTTRPRESNESSVVSSRVWSEDYGERGLVWFLVRSFSAEVATAGRRETVDKEFSVVRQPKLSSGNEVILWLGVWLYEVHIGTLGT